MSLSPAFEEIGKFEAKIGLPTGFFVTLLKEEDWGFVIKLHSLFEGAATHVLNMRLGEGRLESAISHIEFSHSKYGKVQLLRSLEVINPEQANFLRLLSELRNTLVHKIWNVSFAFETHIESLDRNQRKSFFNRVGYNTNDQITVGDTCVPRDQFISENAKFVIWMTASDLLACICLEEDLIKLEKRQRELELAEISFARQTSKLYADIVKTGILKP